MDNKFLFLVFIFFLVFGTFAANVFFEQNTTFRARASNQCEPVVSKSLITSFPKVGEQCEVNVFVRCEDESSVADADVRLSVTNGAVDLPQGTTTNELGQATFIVTPQGLATIQATINGSLVLSDAVTCSSE